MKPKHPHSIAQVMKMNGKATLPLGTTRQFTSPSSSVTSRLAATLCSPNKTKNRWLAGWSHARIFPISGSTSSDRCRCSISAQFCQLKMDLHVLFKKSCKHARSVAPIVSILTGRIIYSWLSCSLWKTSKMGESTYMGYVTGFCAGSGQTTE